MYSTGTPTLTDVADGCIYKVGPARWVMYAVLQLLLNGSL